MKTCFNQLIADCWAIDNRVLNLAEGGNVHALDKVLESFQLLLQLFNAHFVVLHDADYLQLLDIERDWHELSCKRSEKTNSSLTAIRDTH